MIDFVADTHALYWQLTEPSRLSRAARRAFGAAENGECLCHVPAVVLVEIALLHERRRLRLGAAQVAEILIQHPAYAVLSIDVTQALEFASLVGIPDPVDRLVAAAARVTGVRLVSADEVFDAYLDRIWD